MLVALFRCFDDDVPPLQVNSRTLAVSAQRKLRAIADLDYGTVAQPYKSMRILGGSNGFALLQTCACTDRHALRIVDLIDVSFGRLHGGFKLSAERRITLNQRYGQQSKTNYQRRRDSPTQDDRRNAITAFLHYLFSWRVVASARFLHSPATGNTLMRVIYEQQ